MLPKEVEPQSILRFSLSWSERRIYTKQGTLIKTTCNLLIMFDHNHTSYGPKYVAPFPSIYFKVTIFSKILNILPNPIKCNMQKSRIYSNKQNARGFDDFANKLWTKKLKTWIIFFSQLKFPYSYCKCDKHTKVSCLWMFAQNQKLPHTWL